MDSETLEGKVALVTGGSRGIGRSVVEELLRAGLSVYFCSRSADAVRETVAALAHLGPVDGRACDVRDEAQVDALVAWVLGAADRVDVLVNNAGVGTFAPIDEIGGEAFRRTVETNLLGCFYAIQAVVPAMKAQGGGWILNVASLAARNPFAGGAAYNASKFGLLGMTEAAMLDLRHHGIRVAAILPGSVDTEFHAGRRPERDWMLVPDDVARAVLDLLRYPARALPSRIELRPSRPPKS